jgi:hypothetical protein
VVQPSLDIKGKVEERIKPPFKMLSARHYSGLMPAVLITRTQVSSSDLTKAV